MINTLPPFHMVYGWPLRKQNLAFSFFPYSYLGRKGLYFGQKLALDPFSKWRPTSNSAIKLCLLLVEKMSFEIWKHQNETEQDRTRLKVFSLKGLANTWTYFIKGFGGFSAMLLLCIELQKLDTFCPGKYLHCQNVKVCIKS